eukprot:1807003-Pyramimonas_sp.AAC.1
MVGNKTSKGTFPKTRKKIQQTRKTFGHPPLTQTPDVVIFSQRRPLEVWTPSPGPVSHPESLFDRPEARREPQWPKVAKNSPS